MYALMVHGGCGGMSHLTDEKRKANHDSIHHIVSSGEELLKQGKSALDVAEHLVCMLEDDPLYNAGKGSVLNEDGKVDLDASIMDGKTFKAGAIAGVKNIKNPIKLARLVMDKTEYVMFIESGAQKFAELSKVKMEPDDYFITTHRKVQLEEAKKAGQVIMDNDSVENAKKNKTGTVGAVVLDSNGDLAAATSTGGLVNKRFGRVGDSPLIGCGTYADNDTCAVSATGYGEQFIRTALAKFTSDLIELKRLDASSAVKEAIVYLQRKVKGIGGIIVIDKDGNLAGESSAKGMIHGWVKEGEKIEVEI